MEIKDHINNLKDTLNQHNIDYYVYDNPTISDYEYDKLLKELELLESQNPQYCSDDSPTQRVGGTILNEFDSITHRIPMQSLANAMIKDELTHFDQQIMKLLNNIEPVEYVAELKLDGLAVEIVYENGKFKAWSKAMIAAGYAYVLIDIFNSLKLDQAKKITVDDFKKIKMDELLTMNRKTGFFEMIEMMIAKLKNVRN